MFSKIKRAIINIKNKNKSANIDPDFVLIDSENLPDFDTHQLEGRLEKPISKKSFAFAYIFLFVVCLVFLGRFVFLQVFHGEEYREQSENNKLRKNLIFAPRGAIYSRDGVALAYNEKLSIESAFPKRIYANISGISHAVGFLKYPAKDKSGFYYEEEFVPKDGAELYFNKILAGRNGEELIETSVSGEVVSKNTVEPYRPGENVTLSIDTRLQKQVYSSMEELSSKVGFQGGSALMMDIYSGELLLYLSFPEYNPQVMTDGTDALKIKNYFSDYRNPFIDRSISGLYTPGSIVKPFLAFAALEEKIISPQKEIVSTGELVVPNPYNKDKPTIFKDWKAHGATDMRRAIAVSSDVYFYQIGGGYGSQKGLGIQNIKKYLKLFGFSNKTGFDNNREEVGVIPDEEWKKENFKDGNWRVGDTYNTSIGQYGTQITPIQALVAVSALSNGGNIVTPSLMFTSTSTRSDFKKITQNLDNLDISKEGMRLAVTSGTAVGLNVPYVNIGAKTGTAELGSKKQFVNSWVIGFFPYEKPKYAFVALMEKGPVHNTLGATYIMRQLFDYMNTHTKEYLNP